MVFSILSRENRSYLSCDAVPLWCHVDLDLRVLKNTTLAFRLQEFKKEGIGIYPYYDSQKHIFVKVCTACRADPAAAPHSLHEFPLHYLFLIRFCCFADRTRRR